MSDDTSTNAPGPFSSPVNALLSASFGRSLDGISVDQRHESAAAMNARAFTIGNKISLGAGVEDDISDPQSMEIIAHEVAHALAGGGSGEKPLDDGRQDDGEAAAHAASGEFRDFIAGGAKGPAPRLAPAFGGKAAVHRYEAGEHADAVDNAAATVKAANEAGGNYKFNENAAKQVEREITLANGVKVKAGDITAMMGDFYGAYKMGPDGKEHFDPAASFEAMNNADPKEMQALLAKIKEERAALDDVKKNGGEFEHTENAEFEAITNNRHVRTDENGVTTGYSYMDLAQKNSNHFNQKNEVDENGNPITDNNMGAYTAFHGMAMQAAQEAAALPPGPEKEAAEQRALALEASSQHFMTDRFAGGHQFDKQQMVEENGGGKIANMRAKTIHDELNENGAMVENAQGERWRALGDSHWADEANRENREHASEAVLNSYGDIDAIMRGEKTAADFEKDKAATAHQDVPIWDEAENKRLQQAGKDKSVIGMLANQTDEIGLLPTMVETWAKQKYHKGEDWVKEKASDAWESAGDAWEWAKERGNDIGDGAVETWNDVKDGVGETWQDAKDFGSDAVDYGSERLDELREGAGEAWQDAKDYGSDAVDYGEEVVDDISDGAGEVWQDAKEYGSDAVDYGEEVVEDVSEAASEKWEDAKDLADDAGETISDGYQSVKKGALGLIGL